jgi:hypothetical protein
MRAVDAACEATPKGQRALKEKVVVGEEEPPVADVVEAEVEKEQDTEEEEEVSEEASRIPGRLTAAQAYSSQPPTERDVRKKSKSGSVYTGVTRHSTLAGSKVATATSWTEDEDAELLTTVGKVGPGDWASKSAAFSTSRSTEALRLRWYVLRDGGARQAHRRKGQWLARIGAGIGSQNISLGSFGDEKEAARAYDAAMRARLPAERECLWKHGSALQVRLCFWPR